jgi:signal transduction histidine kinase
MAARTRTSAMGTSSPDRLAAGHLVTTRSSRILSADGTAARLLRRSVAALVQKPLAALVDLADRSDFRSRLALLPDAGRLADWRVRVRAPDGSTIAVLASVDAVDGATETELRWALAAASSSPAAGSSVDGEQPTEVTLFGRELSQLAHELNQPLAAIITFVRGAQLRLRKGDLSEADLETALETIAQEALRANAIARNLGQRWRTS